MEVRCGDDIVINTETVLQRQKHSFNGNNWYHDNIHLNHIRKAVSQLETKYNDFLEQYGGNKNNIFIESEFLNKAITYKEVRDVVNDAKYRKAVGTDKIHRSCQNVIVVQIYNLPVCWKKGINPPISNQVIL